MAGYRRSNAKQADTQPRRRQHETRLAHRRDARTAKLAAEHTPQGRMVAAVAALRSALKNSPGFDVDRACGQVERLCLALADEADQAALDVRKEDAA